MSGGNKRSNFWVNAHESLLKPFKLHHRLLARRKDEIISILTFPVSQFFSLLSSLKKQKEIKERNFKETGKNSSPPLGERTDFSTLIGTRLSLSLFLQSHSVFHEKPRLSLTFSASMHRSRLPIPNAHTEEYIYLPPLAGRGKSQSTNG